MAILETPSMPKAVSNFVSSRVELGECSERPLFRDQIRYNADCKDILYQLSRVSHIDRIKFSNRLHRSSEKAY